MLLTLSRRRVYGFRVWGLEFRVKYLSFGGALCIPAEPVSQTSATWKHLEFLFERVGQHYEVYRFC